MEARLRLVSFYFEHIDGRGYIPAVVDVGTAAEEKVLDRLETLGSLITRLVNVELGSTVIHGFLSLGLGAGEDDDVVTHGGGQLDSKMAKATNSNNAY
jgi:hypothetical protein